VARRSPDPLLELEHLIRRVYSYAAYTVGDGPGAESVVSRTIEQAQRRRDRYAVSDGPPIIWLLGMARRQLDDRLHGPRSRTAPPPAVDPRSVGFDDVEPGTAQAAVADLSPSDRELVGLRYGADLATAEIGSLLGIPVPTVEAALNRVHGQLRAALKPTPRGWDTGGRTE
jgi:DNA-directed RNA polymerase specialized sigma24 family protein